MTHSFFTGKLKGMDTVPFFISSLTKREIKKGHLKLELKELVVGKFIQGVVIHINLTQAMKNHHQFHSLAKYSHSNAMRNKTTVRSCHKITLENDCK